MAEDPLQKKYFELYILDQQIQQIQQQLVLLENQTLEITKLLESLDYLEKTKANAPLYAPLAPGVFLQGTIKDAQHIVVNVGASVFLTKTLAESRELFTKQLQEIQEATKQLEPNFMLMQKKAHQLQQEIKKLKPKSEEE